MYLNLNSLFNSSIKVLTNYFPSEKLPTLGEISVILWMKKGHIVHLTSSGEACMGGLTNSETESNHIGRSEHKNS